MVQLTCSHNLCKNKYLDGSVGKKEADKVHKGVQWKACTLELLLE